MAGVVGYIGGAGQPSPGWWPEQPVPSPQSAIIRLLSCLSAASRSARAHRLCPRPLPFSPTSLPLPLHFSPLSGIMPAPRPANTRPLAAVALALTAVAAAAHPARGDPATLSRRASEEGASTARRGPGGPIAYAVLAGAPTFSARIPAAARTWMAAVPVGDVTVYTNGSPRVGGMRSPGSPRSPRSPGSPGSLRSSQLPRSPRSPAVARTIPQRVRVVAPSRPTDEAHPGRMGSWSHLVRLRDAWDTRLAGDASVDWLALVDDDTYVFDGGLRDALAATGADPKSELLWGGALEAPRVDNGDDGTYATNLRNVHAAATGVAGGELPCLLPGDDGYLTRAEEAATSPTVATTFRMCRDTFCPTCAPLPQGAAVVLSRALVAALRPHVETCEAATAGMCEACGSQRLYMCIRYVSGLADQVRTVALPGVERAPWKRSPRGGDAPVISFHAFEHRFRLDSATGSLAGDMAQLAAVADRVAAARGSDARVTYQDVADEVACRGAGTYVHAPKRMCVSQVAAAA